MFVPFLCQHNYIHLHQTKIKNMTQFIVIDLDNASYSYIVNNLKELIKEMYEPELERESFEDVSKKFYSSHKVFEIKGEIKELN